MTWIAPQNALLAIITGSVSGLGINPLATFDWSYLTAINAPLITPLFATLNVYVGETPRRFPTFPFPEPGVKLITLCRYGRHRYSHDLRHLLQVITPPSLTGRKAN